MDNLNEIIGELSPAKRELLARRLNKKLLRFGGIPRRSDPSTPPPLSFAQERLWFVDQIYPDSAAYNIPTALQLSGSLNREALEQSLRDVIRRHEVLRTSFKLTDDGVVQIIAPELPFTLETIDLSGATDREAQVQCRAREQAWQPFKLDAGPAWRACLLRLEAEEHVLLFTMHHIICDGWSAEVLAREVTTLYDAYTRGEPSPLPELPIQYADFVVWQREWLTSDVIATQLRYWKEQLEDRVTPLELPVDRSRKAERSFRGASQSWSFPVELSEALKALGRPDNATLFMVVLAALKSLFHYYSGQQQITIGAPVAHRNRAEVQGLIGLFLNTLVLCTDMSGDPTFRELVRRVRDVSLGAHAHQDVPLEKLVEALQPERSISGQPVFQATYTLQSADAAEATLAGLRVRPLKLDHETAQFDLVVNGIDSKHGLTGVFEYSTELFEAATVARLAENFGRILQTVVARPEIRLSELKQQLREVEQREYEEVRREKFKNSKRRSVRPQLAELVTIEPLAADRPLPLVIRPAVKGVSLREWIGNSRSLVESHLQRVGAILFRDFALQTAEDFQQAAREISGELLEYRERSSPRTHVGGNIYTSTDYPPEHAIFLHNENSYQQTWPMKIFFFCGQPAAEGGETPIADCRRVLQRIAPEVRERFEGRGWMYVRNFGDGFGLPWSTVFQTTDRAQVEQHCRKVGIGFEWKPNNGLRTHAVRPALSRHPWNGELTWFNHATFFHVTTLERRMREALLAEFAADDLPTNTFYGDGTPIETDVLDHLRDAYRQETVLFPWQQGDLLVLDNMLAAHGRSAYRGERQILVGMGQPMTREQLESSESAEKECLTQL